jgi:hypothetical protein
MIYSDFPISVADNVDDSLIEIKSLNDLIEAQKAKEINYQGNESSMILFDGYNSINHNIYNWFYQYRSQLACVSVGHTIPLKTQAQYQANIDLNPSYGATINQTFFQGSTYKFRYAHSWIIGSECDPTALGVRYRVMRSATANGTYVEDLDATQEVVGVPKYEFYSATSYEGTLSVDIEVTVTDNTLKYWKIQADTSGLTEAVVINNPGVLISPRHVLYRVGNTDPMVGYQIRFVSANGTLVFGIVKSVKKTDNGNFIIACLDRDLDKLGINFAKIFDENLIQDFNNQQYISLVGVSGSSYPYEIKKGSSLAGQNWTENNWRLIFPAFEKVERYPDHCFPADPFDPWSFFPDTTDVVPWVAFYFYNNRLILRGIGIISPSNFSSLDNEGKISGSASLLTNSTNVTDCTDTIDGYTIALAAHMAQQVDSRLVGKVAANDQRLFTELTRNQNTSVFTPNTTCWLNDLRSQLCGFHMGTSNYGQGYGLMPLGGRFFLCVAHNGPSLGTTYWPLPDGTTFTTTTESFYLDRINSGGRNTSGNPNAPSGPFDFSIYITAAAAPPTLSIIPIVKLNVNLNLLYALAPPTVSISQGGAHPDLVGKYATLQNRKCAVSPFSSGYTSSYPENTYPLRSSFGHEASSGDSGCPQYLLINNKLYLYKMNEAFSIFIGNGISYLQDLVNRAATAHGIAPVTITTVTNPPLS